MFLFQTTTMAAQYYSYNKLCKKQHQYISTQLASVKEMVKVPAENDGLVC